jgi:hypothetical protein
MDGSTEHFVLVKLFLAGSTNKMQMDGSTEHFVLRIKQVSCF